MTTAIISIYSNLLQFSLFVEKNKPLYIYNYLLLFIFLITFLIDIYFLIFYSTSINLTKR
jgi:hypothetical protein